MPASPPQGNLSQRSGGGEAVSSAATTTVPMEAYFAVGSNLPDRLVNIENGLRQLERVLGGKIVDTSCLYETVAAYIPGPNYLNAVVKMEFSGTHHCKFWDIRETVVSPTTTCDRNFPAAASVLARSPTDDPMAVGHVPNPAFSSAMNETVTGPVKNTFNHPHARCPGTEAWASLPPQALRCLDSSDTSPIQDTYYHEPYLPVTYARPEENDADQKNDVPRANGWTTSAVSDPLRCAEPAVNASLIMNGERSSAMSFERTSVEKKAASASGPTSPAAMHAKLSKVDRHLACMLNWVLERLFELERRTGRCKLKPMGLPRTLDLDLLCARVQVTEPVTGAPSNDVNAEWVSIELTTKAGQVCPLCGSVWFDMNVPHSLAQERRFVLEPLVDIDPNVRLRSCGRPASELLKRLPLESLPEDGRTVDAKRMFAAGLTEEALLDDISPIKIMGVTNLTPDSFAEEDGNRFVRKGGRYTTSDVARAVEAVADQVAQGADVVDIGAESTRPGHEDVSLEEELARLIPFLIKLVGQDPSSLKPVFIDTRKARVVREANKFYPIGINDITGLTGDPEMLRVAKEHNLSVVVVHPRPIHRKDGYAPPEKAADIVQQVGSELSILVRRLLNNGIFRWRIAVDPGIGFGKGGVDNLRLVKEAATWYRELPRGLPIVFGWSRKKFLELLRCNQRRDEFQDRWQLEADILGLELLHHLPRDCLVFIRVHDVKLHRAAINNLLTELDDR